ncbi:hypothetical protein MPER_05644, partial [Moniliophthora perniciosa FA553]
EYNQDIAAQDMVTFMDALKIPPCHICGMSLGTIVALQIAVTYPDRVLSLFLMSHLGLEEGRQEIYESWVTEQTQGAMDKHDLLHAMEGTRELAFDHPRRKMA